MGVRVMHDPDVGAVMYCSTSMWAFGPVFEDEAACVAFLTDAFPGSLDPRTLTDQELERRYIEWLGRDHATTEQNGDL